MINTGLHSVLEIVLRCVLHIVLVLHHAVVHELSLISHPLSVQVCLSFAELLDVVHVGVVFSSNQCVVVARIDVEQRIPLTAVLASLTPWATMGSIVRSIVRSVRRWWGILLVHHGSAICACHRGHSILSVVFRRRRRRRKTAASSSTSVTSVVERIDAMGL